MASGGMSTTPATSPTHHTTQEHPELPLDITRMFADKLFRLDTSMVPQVGHQGTAAPPRSRCNTWPAVGMHLEAHGGSSAVKRRLTWAADDCLTSFGAPEQVAALRQELGAETALRRRQLPLWTPPLEVPFPPLQPAVFPPAFCELPPPPLELFDLEEELAGPLVSLGRCGSGLRQQQAEVRPEGAAAWLLLPRKIRGCIASRARQPIPFCSWRLRASRKSRNPRCRCCRSG